MASRTELMKAVAEQMATRSEWKRRLAEARADLTAAEGSSGEEILENPKAVGQVAQRMQSARDEIDLSERALTAVEVRLEGARRRVLEHDAAVIDRAADKLQGELDRHQARTDELLALLEEHEGRYVPEVDLIDQMHDTTRAGVLILGAPTEWDVPKSRTLSDRIAWERLRADVVRDVASGVDPNIRLREADVEGDRSIYAACVWGPEAVIEAPAFLSQVEWVRRRLIDHDTELLEDDRPKFARWDNKIAALEELERERPLTFEQAKDRANLRRVREARVEWRESASQRRSAIVAELEQLVGPARAAEWSAVAA